MLLTKKAVGIEIGNEGLKMLLAEKSGGALRLNTYNIMPFTPELTKFSFKEPNVLQEDGFVNIAREGFQRLLPKNSVVSVSLPDAIGRVMLLELETRFKSREEGKDIIRWKLKKNFPLNINDLHLDYQVLDEKETGELSLLVSIIARPIITQYEDLLVKAGMEPKYVDFSAFNQYRLFSSRIALSENAAFLTFHNGVFTILIFYEGILSFYRSKEIPGNVFDANRVYREINSSQLVFRDRYPHYSINEVFCLISGEDAESFRSITSEAMGIEPILLDVGRVITAKDSTDRKTLQTLTAALGAAARML